MKERDEQLGSRNGAERWRGAAAENGWVPRLPL